MVQLDTPDLGTFHGPEPRGCSLDSGLPNAKCVLFLKTALLRYDSRMCSPPGYRTRSWGRHCVSVVSNSPWSHLRMFLSPPKEAPSPSPALDTHSPTLALWVCLFWTVHVNGVTHCVALCVRCLSLSVSVFRVRPHRGECQCLPPFTVG